MHLNDESPMGKDALAAGDAAMAGPTNSTAMPTLALRMPDAADWIVIIGNSPMLFIAIATERQRLSRYYIAVSMASRNCETMKDWKFGAVLSRSSRLLICLNLNRNASAVSRWRSAWRRSPGARR